VSASCAVFLDRDGTVIHDVGYISDPELVELVPGAPEALAALKAHGYRLVLVSNQSGIGRGYFGCEDARAVHERMVAELERRGVELDDAHYCPHAPDEGCDCRKPRPGLLFRAARALDVDLGRSVMVGNRSVDVEAGRAAGCRTILLGADAGWPDVVARVESWELE
jgi:D-glycero-D-manno-heptose 1,7-bisphosphate phosphatase